MRKKIIKMYLDYVNNFLSVYRFADHYDIDPEKAYRVIDIGRQLNG